MDRKRNLILQTSSGEGSFSKLKSIKTYFRSTMSQDRLKGLAIISIERDMLKRVRIDVLANKFA